MSAAGSLQAQISVGASPTGSGVLTFDSAPAATEFATRAVPGANSAPTTTAAMDTAIQTNLAANITGTLGTEATALAAFTPALANFQWRSDAGLHHLASRATGGSLNLMKVTLRNDSGADATAVDIDFDLGVTFNQAFTISEDTGLAGFRVYYSLTGGTNGFNQWTVIPGLSSGTAGHLTGHVDLIWPNTSLLYLYFADDNGVPGSSDPAAPATTGNVEGCYSIDNFRVVPTTGTIPCAGITNQPANVNLPQCPAGNATFSISVTGGVQSVQWYRQNGGGGFNAISGANSASYTLPGAAVSDNGAQFRAVVTPISGSCASVTSSVATLTVVQDVTPPAALYAVRYLNPTNITLTNITVVFSESIDTNNPDLWSNWTLVDTNTGSTVDLFGQIYLNSTTVVLDTDTLNPTHGYTLDLQLVFDTCANNEMPFNTIPVYSFVSTPLALTAPWKYLDNDIFPGAGWFGSGFDDSGWLSGTGPFDAKRNANYPVAPSNCRSNTLYMMQGPVPTCLRLESPVTGTNLMAAYFRTHFNYTGNTNKTLLQLSGKLDDGAAIYLNGTELTRIGINGNTDPVTNGTQTLRGGTVAGSVGDGEGRDIALFNATSLLHQGNNVLAVILIQNNLTSSDLTMGLEAHAFTLEKLAEPPQLHISNNGGVVTVTWSGGGTLQRSLDIGSPANWVNISGASSPFITNAPPAIQFFRVTVP